MRFLLICGALALAAGCGQKGPLYLSDNPPAGTKLQKPPPYKPVPYPKDAADQDQK
jgi:predicted small lipoprotein YifL